jgi:hypothetical protein
MLAADPTTKAIVLISKPPAASVAHRVLDAARASGKPPNLYEEPVTLADGRVVDGILYPRELAEGHHRNISQYGGWRAYWTARERGEA